MTRKALVSLMTAAATAAISMQTMAANPQNSSKAASAVKTAVGFTDIQGNAAEKYIKDLKALGVFDGMGSTFKPDEPITRGEYCTWVFKANNAINKGSGEIRLAPAMKQQFGDLPPSNPCYQFVQALAHAGYSVGYPDGTFRPNQPLTREEMLGIKVGVDYGKSIEPNRSAMAYQSKFGDSDKIEDRFTGYVLQDLHGPANIERAFGHTGVFLPKEAVTRAEAAASIWATGGQFWNFNNAEKARSSRK